MEVIFIVIMVGGLYFIMFRPQQKRMRAHQALVRSLEVGDLVVTGSGIHGAIAEIDDQVVWLEVAPDVELKVSRSSVAERIEGSEPEEFETGQPVDDEA